MANNLATLFILYEGVISMVKKYRDADEVIKTTELSKNLYLYDQQMREIPNFNKSFGAKKIFQRKEYSIYRVKDGFIIHNTNLPFKGHHTHISSFHKAKSLVDLCIRKKLPDTPRAWEIQSLLRISNNQTYKNKLLMLLQELEG